MSTRIERYGPRDVEPVKQGQIVHPDDVVRLQQMAQPGQLIVVQQAGKPWGWWIGGGLLLCFMLFSFASWLINETLQQAEKTAERAHELSMRSLELAESRRAGPSFDLSGVDFSDPGIVLVIVLITIGVGLVLRGIIR